MPPDTPSLPLGHSESAVIGAIRLAMYAGSDHNARVRVIREILARAPETEANDTASVLLLVEAVQAAKVEFHVTDHEPRGRLTKAGAS
jgi:hypothetical protein